MILFAKYSFPVIPFVFLDYSPLLPSVPVFILIMATSAIDIGKGLLTFELVTSGSSRPPPNRISC